MKSVMGYSAVSMKGKTITVEGVATPQLGTLLEAAEAARQALVRDLSQTLNE